MRQLKYQINDSRMPVGLGTAAKVPWYAWANWSVDDSYSDNIIIGEEGYRLEWDLVTEQGHEDIKKASENAGFGNMPLNEVNAQIVSRTVQNNRRNNYILDVGAGSGNTSVSIVERLYNDNVDLDRVHITLLDQAKESLGAARERLESNNLKYGKNFETVQGTDWEIPDKIEKQMDIVTTVAALHHHPDILRTVDNFYNVLKKEGYLFVADWHNSMWEHPNRVYKLLKMFDWKTKDRDLDAFLEAYPKAFDYCPEPEDPLDRKANEQIMGFWLEYAKIKSTENNQFMILEGHRPHHRYLEDYNAVGFSTESPGLIDIMETNPIRITPGSNLHMETGAQKL